jgi:hypothetical protein
MRRSVFRHVVPDVSEGRSALQRRLYPSQSRRPPAQHRSRSDAVERRSVCQHHMRQPLDLSAAPAALGLSSDSQSVSQSLSQQLSYRGSPAPVTAQLMLGNVK